MLRLSQKAPSLLLRSEMEYARRLINFVLQNLTLKDRKLRWEYKKPFDILAKTAKNDNWQGLVDELEKNYTDTEFDSAELKLLLNPNVLR